VFFLPCCASFLAKIDLKWVIDYDKVKQSIADKLRALQLAPNLEVNQLSGFFWRLVSFSLFLSHLFLLVD
jgi:hypothetical protein